MALPPAGLRRPGPAAQQGRGRGRRQLRDVVHGADQLGVQPAPQR